MTQNSTIYLSPLSLLPFSLSLSFHRASSSVPSEALHNPHFLNACTTTSLDTLCQESITHCASMLTGTRFMQSVDVGSCFPSGNFVLKRSSILHTQCCCCAK